LRCRSVPLTQTFVDEEPLLRLPGGVIRPIDERKWLTRRPRVQFKTLQPDWRSCSRKREFAQTPIYKLADISSALSV
jgi:hypothetical protein